jgi:kynurenine formamidase
MMVEDQLNKAAKTRIIDLSHRLTPGTQRFLLELHSRPVEQYLPQYRVPEGEWYIMTDVQACTHVGTHVEAPYHAFKDGKTVAELDLSALIGPAAVVDFSDKGADQPISRTEMIERGTHIESEDILLIRTGLSRHYLTAKYRRPYLETEAVDWLIRRGIKALGIDCSGFENRSVQSHEVNHRKLLGRGIPVIEDMNNLDRLAEERVFFIALPLPIEGLDACWIRPIAVEPLTAGRKLAEIFLGTQTSWES